MDTFLTIRREQLAVMAPAVKPDFVDWMTAHLRKSFPVKMKNFDEVEIVKFIEDGHREACGYGVNSSQAFCKFIDLKVVFGDDFHQNPEYPWIKRTLNDTEISDPNQRVEIVARLAAKRK